MPDETLAELLEEIVYDAYLGCTSTGITLPERLDEMTQRVRDAVHREEQDARRQG